MRSPALPRPMVPARGLRRLDSSDCIGRRDDRAARPCLSAGRVGRGVAGACPNDRRRGPGKGPQARKRDPARKDRKSVVMGKQVSVSVELGGRRAIKKKKKLKQYRNRSKIEK